MTDLVLLLPDRAGSLPDSREVRFIVKERHATVASVCMPRINKDGSLEERVFAAYHHQHGVDLSTIDPLFRLRDIILVKLPDTSQGQSVNFCLVYFWNWPDSTYDIDAVRIPHAKKTDPRNNPLGKNPGNVWSFSEPLHDGKGGIQCALIVQSPAGVFSCGVEVDAVRRLVQCHTLEGDTVHVWAPRDDLAAIEILTRDLERDAKPVAPGSPDPLVEVPIEVDDAAAVVEPTQLLWGRNWPVKQGGKENPQARYVIQDAASGIPLHVAVPIDDLVTSPPYNIGYDPFNVPKPDPRSGLLVAPKKEGYKDDLPRAAYHSMIRRTLAAVDARMSPGSADAFINLKNSYSGGECNPPFWMLKLVPRGWLLSDVLVWRYDISYDPAKGKYKPYYEWILRFTKGKIYHPDGHPYMQDHYIPILKGNSKERLNLVHPAIYPKQVVKACLKASGHEGLVVDPFLGSGTTIAAAWEADRPSIGFEIDGRYVPDIEARLAQATRPALEPRDKHSIPPGGRSP